ncbi:hypothetical protein BGC_09870 [Burkholderia sp. 3C]
MRPCPAAAAGTDAHMSRYTGFCGPDDAHPVIANAAISIVTAQLVRPFHFIATPPIVSAVRGLFSAVLRCGEAGTCADLVQAA